MGRRRLTKILVLDKQKKKQFLNFKRNNNEGFHLRFELTGIKLSEVLQALCHFGNIHLSFTSKTTIVGASPEMAFDLQKIGDVSDLFISLYARFIL